MHKKYRITIANPGIFYFLQSIENLRTLLTEAASCSLFLVFNYYFILSSFDFRGPQTREDPYEFINCNLILLTVISSCDFAKASLKGIQEQPLLWNTGMFDSNQILLNTLQNLLISFRKKIPSLGRPNAFNVRIHQC